MELDSDDERDDICFEARTDDARRITSILSSICVATSRKADSSASLAWCEVSDTGLTFTVNVSKTLQAIAYVKRKGVFHTWELAMPHRGEVPDERLEFGINLATLLECLKIFGGAAAPTLAAVPRLYEPLQVSYALDRCLAFWCLASGGEGHGEEQQAKQQQQQKWFKSKAFCGSMPCLGGFPYHACTSHSG
jgi:hypothetical protein